MTKRIRTKKHYPVYDVLFSGNELKYVADAIRTGWVSPLGPCVKKFEESFAAYLGVRYALTVCNGTVALHLALLALDIGPGDEVVVPSLTFVATANAVRHAGAKPVFVDVEPTYWQMDHIQIERVITRRTKAIIPVHFHGHPAKMDAIMRIARTHHLFVIEDNAQSPGAKVHGKMAGSWGDIATFSFFGNKTITTGEGGMVVTNRKQFADKMAMLRNHGLKPGEHYRHSMVGYNYRMGNLQAAVGLAQLERIRTILAKKRTIAAWYRKYLSPIEGLMLPEEAPWAWHTYWLYSVVIDTRVIRTKRDALISHLKKEGVEVRPFYVPVHKQPCYPKYHHLVLPETEYLSFHGINLPSAPTLTEKDVAEIASRIARVLRS